MSFSCNICTKDYKSYKSLWNHNSKCHSDQNIIINRIDNKIRNFECSKCPKKFTTKQSLIHHTENTCKKKGNNDELQDLKKQVAELQKIVTTNSKNTTNNNHGTINNTTNNTVNNIIYINKTGNENYLELNEKETTEIFSKEISGVVSLIKYINFNERLPSNHSFCTKSLEGKYLLKFNSEEAKIESLRKKYFYQELLASAVTKMELLYKKYKPKFSKDKQTKIEDTINRLKDIKDRDFSDTILREIKNQLIQLSYNCRNTVLKTWDNHKLEPNENDIEEEYGSLFIENSDSISDSESDLSESPIEIIKKTKKTTKDIEI
jgi:hypothetical protein